MYFVDAYGLGKIKLQGICKQQRGDRAQRRNQEGMLFCDAYTVILWKATSSLLHGTHTLKGMMATIKDHKLYDYCIYTYLLFSCW